MDSDYDIWLSTLGFFSQSKLKQAYTYPAVLVVCLRVFITFILGSSFLNFTYHFYASFIAVSMLLLQYLTEKFFIKYMKYTGIVLCFMLNSIFFIHGMHQTPETAKYYMLSSFAVVFCSDFMIYSTSNLSNIMKMVTLIMWYSLDLFTGSFSISNTIILLIPISLVLWFISNCNSNKDEIFRMIYNFQKAVDFERFKLASVLNSIPDCLIVIKSDMQIEIVNDYFRQVFSIGDFQDVHAVLNSLNYSESRRAYPYSQDTSSFMEDITHFMQAEILNTVTFGMVKYEDKYFEWRGSKTKWNGCSSIIMISREVTSIIHLEISRSESKYKTEMLRSVSHELRTPTGAILSLSENMLELPNLSDKLIEDLEMVQVCSKLLLNLMNDLLDYSQLMTGTFTVNKISFEIKPFLEECKSLVKIQCQKRNLEIKLFIDSDVPDKVYTDPDRLRQVILNLLSNSIK